jgi:hypothetical protein
MTSCRHRVCRSILRPAGNHPASLMLTKRLQSGVDHPNCNQRYERKGRPSNLVLVGESGDSIKEGGFPRSSFPKLPLKPSDSLCRAGYS